jgi:hypothetical protein
VGPKSLQVDGIRSPRPSRSARCSRELPLGVPNGIRTPRGGPWGRSVGDRSEPTRFPSLKEPDRFNAPLART